MTVELAMPRRKPTRPPIRRAVHPDAPASGPTREFLQHHDVLKPEMSAGAKREAWQINPRFEQLAPDEGMRTAANRWRRDWDIGMEGMREKNILLRAGWSPYRDHFSDRQIDALTRLIACRIGIKSYAFLLVQLCLIEDRSWYALAHSLGFANYRTVKNLTRSAFLTLSQYCDEMDRVGISGDHGGLPSPKPQKNR